MAKQSKATVSHDKVTGSSGILTSSNGPFTIAFWFQLNSTGQTLTYFFESYGTSGTNQWAIIYGYVSNDLEFYNQNGSGANPRTGSQITINDTNWHHIVYRKDASGASNWDFFLDGVKTSISTSINFTLPASLTNYIIFQADNGIQAIKAASGELNIWSVSLTDNQIKALAKGISPTLIKPTSLVLRLGLLGTSGTKEPDLSGNGRNGTVDGTFITSGPPIGPLFPGDYQDGSEYTTATTPLTKSVSDTFSFSDIIGSGQGSIFSDTVTLADLIAITGTGNNQNLGDSLSLSDSPSLLSTGVISKADTISLQDAVFFFIPLGYSFSDTLTLAENFLMMLGLLQSFNESLSLSDAITFGNVIKRILFDNILLTDFAKYFLASNIFRDQVTLQDNLAMFLTVALSRADTISLNDSQSINKSTLTSQSVSDTLSLSDTVSVSILQAITSYIRRYLNDVIGNG